MAIWRLAIAVHSIPLEDRKMSRSLPRCLIAGFAVGLAVVHLAEAAPGGVDPAFVIGAGASSTVKAAAELPDGSVVIGGSFYSFNGVNRRGLAKLASDGSLVAGWVPPESYSVECLAALPDGKFLVGGDSFRFGEISRVGIARLNADGSLDATFDASAVIDGSVHAVAVREDGKIVVGGNFTNRIARLLPDGASDPTFTPGTGPDNAVYALALLPGDRILAGGSFSRVAGAERRYLALLNPDGTLNPSFGAGGVGPDGTVYALATEPGGSVLVGGGFHNFDGVSRRRLARLDDRWRLDAGLDADLNSTVESIAVRDDGRILVGGSFTTAGGSAANRVALLRADGRLDSGFPTSFRGVGHGRGGVAGGWRQGVHRRLVHGRERCLDRAGGAAGGTRRQRQAGDRVDGTNLRRGRDEFQNPGFEFGSDDVGDVRWRGGGDVQRV